MSVPIKHCLFHVPANNPKKFRTHLKIEDNEAVISTDGEFFTKGIALAYNADYPKEGTTVTFQTDGNIKCITSTKKDVPFTKDENKFRCLIPAKMISDAVKDSQDVEIGFTVETYSGGRHDPQIRVTPF